MKVKKLVAAGLAAVMTTATMGTTVFADGLQLEAHPDQTYYMVTFCQDIHSGQSAGEDSRMQQRCLA